MIRNLALVGIIAIFSIMFMANHALFNGAVAALDAYGNRYEDARDMGYCTIQERVQPFDYTRGQFYSVIPSVKVYRSTRWHCLSRCMTRDITKCWFVPEDGELVKKASSRWL